MYRNLQRGHAGAAALALSLSVLLAPATAAAETDLYRVEVIVFTQQDDGSERWPVRPDPVAFQQYAELREDASPGETAFRQLDGGDLELRSVARRLDDASAYRVLEHLGWVQPGLERERTPAVAMPPGRTPAPAESANEDDAPALAEATDDHLADSLELAPRPPEGLSGGLRVSRERFLHVETDFRWLEPGRDEQAPRAALASAALDDLEPVVVMQERRRMRGDELHYLDHPRLGMLIRVKRVEE